MTAQTAREQIVEEVTSWPGVMIGPHPVFPGREGLAARRIDADADIRDVIELVRLNYERAHARDGMATGSRAGERGSG